MSYFQKRSIDCDVYKQKLDVRVRKREQLPADSKYRSEKYDAAFVETLMSDDEDEIDLMGNTTGKMVSRPPEYRSDEVRCLK